MELKQLYFFSVAADLQHITKAAEKLTVSQPFLTKCIKQLESELGVKLFTHHGRKVVLNDFGYAFSVHVQNILNELDYAQKELNEMAGRLSHTVNVITNIGLYMPYILECIRKEEPGLNLIQSSSKRDNIIETLRTGSADYALCSPPLKDLNNLGIVSETLMMERVYVMFSPDHPLKQRKKIDITELDGLDYYTSPKGYGMRDVMDEAFLKANIKPRIAIETTDTSLIASYIASGAGFAFIPMSIANLSKMKDCSTLTGFDSNLISICWNEKAYKTKYHLAYLETVRNHFKNMQSLVTPLNGLI